MSFAWLPVRVARRRVGNCFRPSLEPIEERTLLSTFTVTNLGDGGTGSGLQGDLRYCVNTANANTDLSNHIVFQPGLAGTISLQLGRLVVTKNLEIDGPGAGLLTVSGGGLSGVFEISNDPSAQDFRLAGVTVADGIGVLVGGSHEGGGLFNWHADVTLTNCVFTGNVAGGSDTGRGGAILSVAGSLMLTNCTVTGNQSTGSDSADGGGIYLQGGTLALNHCTISDNAAGGFGGGLLLYFDSVGVVTVTDTAVTGNTARIGGAAYDNSPATWLRCTISDNVALSAGGVAVAGDTFIDSTIADNAATATVGGGLYNSGETQLTLIGCTISGNSAAMDGGGLYWGGGLATITDCTFSGNSAADGGGIDFYKSNFQGRLELTGCTITQNLATDAGGLDVGSSVMVALVDNTILAGNQAAGAADDVRGAVLSLGYNLVGERDDSTGWQLTDRTGTSASPLDPRLGPLQDNGGPTWTQAPFADSPAIDHGDPVLYNSRDQRGTDRIFDGFDHGPDIGAVEVQNAVSLRLVLPDHVTAGQAFALTVVALDSWGNTATTYGDTVSFDSTDLGAVLPADYAFAAGDQGQQTFAATLNTPGTQAIRVTDVNNPNINSTVSTVVENPFASVGSPGTVGDLVAWQFDGTGWHARRR